MNRTMEKMLFARIAAFVALILLTATTAPAQQPASGSLAVMVSGLSAQTRDQIAWDLAGRGEVRIAYACVPAGILVFEAVNGALRADLQQDINDLLDQRVGRSNISVSALDQVQLEAQCAATRDL